MTRLGKAKAKDGKSRDKDKDKDKDKVRYAVVGLGHIAQIAVLPAFKSATNSELFALVSGNPEKLKKLGKTYAIQHLYSYEDYGRALSNVDAVYLALPNHLHREYAVRAAAAGVHVLCEKPMAVTTEDCEAMIEAAHQNRAKLMIAYRLHFEAGNLQAIRLARSGKLGDLRMFTSEFSQQVAGGNVRVSEFVAQGGGPVYDMGVYCINAARYLFGDEPTQVFAVTANDGDERFQQVEEMTSVVMHFPQDRLASFTCSFGAANVSQYSLIGTQGVLRADPAYEYAMAIQHHLTIGEKKATRTFSKRDQFAAELVYFSDCVTSDKEPQPSGLEGMADIRIVEAIYESVRTNRVVRLPELRIENRPTIRQAIHRPAHGKPQMIYTKPPSREAA